MQHGRVPPELPSHISELMIIDGVDLPASFLSRSTSPANPRSHFGGGVFFSSTPFIWSAPALDFRTAIRNGHHERRHTIASRFGCPVQCFSLKPQHRT